MLDATILISQEAAVDRNKQNPQCPEPCRVRDTTALTWRFCGTVRRKSKHRGSGIHVEAVVEHSKKKKKIGLESNKEQFPGNPLWWECVYDDSLNGPEFLCKTHTCSFFIHVYSSTLAWERKGKEMSDSPTSCLAVMVWSSEASLMFFRQPEQRYSRWR